MATYNREYRWNPPRRKKQRYALVERVVDFSNAPWTSGTDASNPITTAWAAADVLQAIKIKAGQTIMGVEFELITRSTTSGAKVSIGYGDDDGFWGSYEIGPNAFPKFEIPQERASARRYGEHKDHQNNFGNPLYFSSSDTIDITINKAITVGKMRLIVHLMEDDK